jgi:polysaccharide deacetylase family protein (PEP-CTERM system associated)
MDGLVPGVLPAPRGPVVGAFTVDVEEYFHVENLRALAPPPLWDVFPSRIEASVARLLDLLDEHAVTATFFTLGWVAERHPRVVERIACRGHEIASHGYGHEMLTELDPERFRRDLRRSRAALEDRAQRRVVGYRAPTWSIGPATEWALDVLVAEGFRYDASIFPVRHDRYGDPAAPIVPHRRARAGGSIVELPPLVLRALGTNLPAAGGGYLRLLPLALVRAAVRQAIRDGRPAVLYIHPWEIDPDQPRLPVGRLRALRHYGGLARCEAKVARLLAEHRFARAIDLVEAFEASERKPATRVAEAA